MEVPSETIASRGRRGSERIVEGLSPVNGAMVHDGLKP